MKLIELVQKLQATAQPNLEVVCHYPEFDYPFSIQDVVVQTYRDPDQTNQSVVSLKLGDE